MSRAVIWAKEDPFGVEFAEIALDSDHLYANGVSIGSTPLPYRLEYQLETSTGFVTTRLRLTVRGQGWGRELDLRRDASGSWTSSRGSNGDVDLPLPNGALPALEGALDCDLALSPMTNSMPILRHRLHAGGQSHDFKMAWVSLPDLGVRASLQRYVFVRRDESMAVIRYESRDGDFQANLVVDADGLVVDYPGIGRMIRSSRAADSAPGY